MPVEDTWLFLDSGDIISYHIYDKEDFEDYLFLHTRLETPD